MAYKMEFSYFPSKEMMESFSHRCKDMAQLSLSIAWTLGREFAESYPQKAKFLLVIENLYSDLLPDTTRKELLDLSDYASMLVLQMICYTQRMGQFDKATLIQFFDSFHKTFREGIILVFKSGVANYYQTNNE
jgi:hypothetical protein